MKIYMLSWEHEGGYDYIHAWTLHGVYKTFIDWVEENLWEELCENAGVSFQEEMERENYEGLYHIYFDIYQYDETFLISTIDLIKLPS